MSISITSLNLGTWVCQYNPDNTPRKILHTVVVAGVCLAYCDTQEEAQAVLDAVCGLRTNDRLVP